MSDTSSKELVWIRLENWGYYNDLDDEDAEFVEIAQDHRIVYIRRGNLGQRGTVKSTTLATQAAAAASVERRVATFEKKGWIRDRSVTQPMPQPLATRIDGASRERIAAAAKMYEAGLHACGILPASSFAEQAAARKVSWNAVAAACVEVAARTFGVRFAGHYLDETEHEGDTFPIPEDRLAEFYVRPSRVADIARRKLKGQLEEHDGRWELRGP